MKTQPQDNSHQLTFWQRLDRRLLPEDQEIGKTRYIWLSYLAMFFVSFFFMSFNTSQIVVSAIGIAAFLLLYFRTFWIGDDLLPVYIGGIWLIGFALALHRLPGASVFFVYSGAFCAQFRNSRRGFIVLLVSAAATIVFSLLAGITPYIYLPGAFFSLLIGTSNLFLSQMAQKNKQIKASQKEIQQIAASAERERIARDLHDLIGHTFSTINVKAQLAAKLVERQPHKALREIEEIENISRTSLTQVREAVSGYQQRELSTELVHARVLLDSLDIKVTESITPVEELRLSPQQNSSLALIVRELTTNIMRHARASQCHLSLEKSAQQLKLSIRDNGIATQPPPEGSGLQGIRQRVRDLGGQVAFAAEKGFEVIVTMELK